MKKLFGIFFFSLGLFLLVGCSAKPSKEVQEVIDAIVDIEQQKDYSYEEDRFSMKIFHDEATNSYIIDVISPYTNSRGVEKEMESLYSYRLGEIESADSVNRLPEVLGKADFKEVYKSGKFNK